MNMFLPICSIIQAIFFNLVPVVLRRGHTVTRVQGVFALSFRKNFLSSILEILPSLQGLADPNLNHVLNLTSVTYRISLAKYGSLSSRIFHYFSNDLYMADHHYIQ